MVLPLPRKAGDQQRVWNPSTRSTPRAQADVYGRYDWTDAHQTAVPPRRSERQRRRANPTVPTTLVTEEQEGPVSYHDSFIDAQHHPIQPFPFFGLPNELRDKIYDYLLPTNLRDRTLDFHLLSSVFHSSVHHDVRGIGSSDHSIFLPGPPLGSHALLRACKETRAGYLARFMTHANVRLIMHHLIHRVPKLNITRFEHIFCQDPCFRNSFVCFLALPQDWLPHIKKLTIWLLLPFKDLKLSSSFDCEPLAILFQMSQLRQLELVFKTVRTVSPTPSSNDSHVYRDLDDLEEEGSSPFLTGFLIDLFDTIPQNIQLCFNDRTAESRRPSFCDTAHDKTLPPIGHPSLVWNTQEGVFKINGDQETTWDPVKDHLKMKRTNVTYESHFGPARAVSSDVIQKLYDRFKVLRVATEEQGEEPKPGV